MTISRRRHRTARKLLLPLIAVAMMTTMMYLHSTSPAAASTPAAVGPR
ncbi:MAG TPA: hypothetical protein VIV40_43750 [Kofleriaceae bacterium]